MHPKMFTANRVILRCGCHCQLGKQGKPVTKACVSDELKIGQNIHSMSDTNRKCVKTVQILTISLNLTGGQEFMQRIHDFLL